MDNLLFIRRNQCRPTMEGYYGPDLASKVSEWVPSTAFMGAMLPCLWCLWATVAHPDSRLPSLSFLMGNLKFLLGTVSTHGSSSVPPLSYAGFSLAQPRSSHAATSPTPASSSHSPAALTRQPRGAAKQLSQRCSASHAFSASHALDRALDRAPGGEEDGRAAHHRTQELRGRPGHLIQRCRDGRAARPLTWNRT